jgi:four helix bundle protein
MFWPSTQEDQYFSRARAQRSGARDGDRDRKAQRCRIASSITTSWTDPVWLWKDVADSFAMAKGPSGHYRHARDQWLRAAQSIPLNIAAGNGKRSVKDRSRFLEIARGFPLECAAIQDVLVICGGMDAQMGGPLQATLQRILAMLTRLARQSDRVAESAAWYNSGVDCEHEHRCAEHERSQSRLAIQDQNHAIHRSGDGQRHSGGKSIAATR